MLPVDPEVTVPAETQVVHQRYADGMGTTELIIVAVVLLVLFGGSQLPKLARSIGEAQREFKQGLKDGAEDDAGESAAKDTK